MSTFSQIIAMFKEMLAYFLEIYNRIMAFFDKPLVDISDFIK